MSEKVKIATLGQRIPGFREDVVIIGFGEAVCLNYTPETLCRNPSSNELRSAVVHVWFGWPGTIKVIGDDNQNACQVGSNLYKISV